MSQLITKKNIATILVLGIMVLSIPFGLDLMKQRQEIRSKAAELSNLNPSVSLTPRVFNTRTLSNDSQTGEPMESITAYGKGWNFIKATSGRTYTGVPYSGGYYLKDQPFALDSVDRYKQICAGHEGNCVFNTRTLSNDSQTGEPVESITAYGKGWNFIKATSGRTYTGVPYSAGYYLKDQPFVLDSIDRYKQICAGHEGSCVFDTRVLTTNSATGEPMESITAYGKGWNFIKDTTGRYTGVKYSGGYYLSSPSFALESVDRYQQICAGHEGSCVFDTRVLTTNSVTGEPMESITAYGKGWNFIRDTTGRYTGVKYSGGYYLSSPSFALESVDRYQIILPDQPVTPTTAPSSTPTTNPTPTTPLSTPTDVIPTPTTPLPGARFINQSMTLTTPNPDIGLGTCPTTPLRSGEPMTITIDMENNGEVNWTPGTFRLVSLSPQNDSAWGINPDSLTANALRLTPQRFILNVTAPRLASQQVSQIYTLQWQMAQGSQKIGNATFACTVTVLANCDSSGPNNISDGVINEADFEEWKAEFTNVSKRLDADCNYDKKIDLLDFNIWRNIVHNL